MGIVHKRIEIFKEAGDERDIVIALLGEHGYNGFEEVDNSLLAFIPVEAFEVDALNTLAAELEFTYALSDVEEQNWNAIWEAEFEPVVVGVFCTVRAHFHEPAKGTAHEIVITPKMSFGTGHHATTQLMIMAMEYLDFKGKRVLDFGTGTGVLAILAEKLGSEDVLAIDNDTWSVTNSEENLERNMCKYISVRNSSVEEVEKNNFDIILANINRHILLATMPVLYSKLAKDGKLIMSGLLVEDEDIIRESAVAAGFSITGVSTLNGWISIQCGKC